MSPRKPSLLRRVLARLGRWLGRGVVRERPVPAQPLPVNPTLAPAQDGEDRMQQATLYKIQVEEVDQVEFIQEWGRSVAMTRSGERVTETTAQPDHDRRLPHHDRRQPRSDRRGVDRREPS